MSITTETAPIVLFVFARPEHTRRTLAALSANKLADQSELIVYSDASRSDREVEQVQAVRHQIHKAAGFRRVTVIEREHNYGLARNITEGVTEACQRYGKAIVLEDDVVTSTAFLTFMNSALVRYRDEPRVWHVSGWNYPIDHDGLPDAFFWRAMNCWGWGTWADRWRHFEKDPRRLTKAWDNDKVMRFNLDGAHDFWRQVTANKEGKINTWAIFWYTTIFERGGLCLNPARTFVRNIGNDGSGEHCGADDPFASSGLAEAVGQLPDQCEESMLALQRIKAFYKTLPRTFLHRFSRRVEGMLHAASRGWRA